MYGACVYFNVAMRMMCLIKSRPNYASYQNSRQVTARTLFLMHYCYYPKFLEIPNYHFSSRERSALIAQAYYDD